MRMGFCTTTPSSCRARPARGQLPTLVIVRGHEADDGVRLESGIDDHRGHACAPGFLDRSHQGAAVERREHDALHTLAEKPLHDLDLLLAIVLAQRPFPDDVDRRALAGELARRLDRPGMNTLPEFVRRSFGDHGDLERSLDAGLGGAPPGAGPAAPRDPQGGDQDRRQLRRHGSSMRRTWTVWGPCTPTTRVSSMSEVRDGPVMNVMAWLATLRRASASPSDSQMQGVDRSATWIGGTSESSRLRSRADSNTSVPVSAIPHCAVVTPASHANSSSRERRSSRSVASTRPFPTDCSNRCTSGASEPTTRRAPASVRMRASAAAASASPRTVVHRAPTAVSCSVNCVILTACPPLPSGVLTP